jgi:hypothetical protein
VQSPSYSFVTHAAKKFFFFFFFLAKRLLFAPTFEIAQAVLVVYSKSNPVTGSSIAVVRTKSTFLNPLLPYSFLPLENAVDT